MLIILICLHNNTWTRENIKNNSFYTERYSLKLGNGECIISVPTDIDTDGLIIATWDGDRRIFEHIDLKDGNSYCTDVEGNTDRGQYGLFTEKYQEKAKNLPEHVRKMLAGHYGIE
ncbi:hypothetical protein KKB98_00770 [Patescibacteria group bacterium]|nr:hypothetical protein [Patescibacteria group bacterium]MCG2809233.1 hypothetical protein [Candidatus Portnoybacteria bacterium]